MVEGVGGAYREHLWEHLDLDDSLNFMGNTCLGMAALGKGDMIITVEMVSPLA